MKIDLYVSDEMWISPDTITLSAFIKDFITRIFYAFVYSQFVVCIRLVHLHYSIPYNS